MANAYVSEAWGDETVPGHFPTTVAWNPVFRILVWKLPELSIGLQESADHISYQLNQVHFDSDSNVRSISMPQHKKPSSCRSRH